MSSDPQPQPQPQPSPKSRLQTAILTSDPPSLKTALATYRTALKEAQDRQGRESTPKDLHWALEFAVKALRPESVAWLIDEAGCGVGGLRVGTVGAGVVGRVGGLGEVEGDEGEERARRVLEVLVGRGWDINAWEGSPTIDTGYLIYYLTDSYPLTQWALSHGAHTTYPTPDPASTAPILEVVAKNGFVSTFKLLQEHGAQVGKRTLHRAAEAAAWAESGSALPASPERLAQRMAMVRFLVEEVGCDVNGMDGEEGTPNFFGTPLNYAAHTRGGREVVRYLLEKGADPRMRDRWGVCDAFAYAKGGNPGVMEVLNEWKEQREKQEA